MSSTSTWCPACHTLSAAEEPICVACGLLFASYVPPTNSTTPPQATTFTYVPLIPGQSLANGRFTVRQALSKGGMGAIYLASDNEAFGRMVVVKAMLDYFDPADADAVREARARFLQEARTLSLLRHPAIPQIFTYFQEGPHNYIVMEYIEGYDLEQQLTHRDDASGQRIDGHAYPQSNVLRWGVTLCQVLVYLSSRQPHAVVHHDIKPANLLLNSSSDDIRLVDFGTAKTRLFALAGSVGLQQSSVHGTQGYAAPEQYRGQSEPRWSAATPDPNAAHYQAAVEHMGKQNWDAAIGEFRQLTGTYNDPVPGEAYEIRHMPDGKLLRTINGLPNNGLYNNDPQDIAWSPNGRMLAFSYASGLIKIARAEDGTTLSIVESKAKTRQALAWSPDGQTLASCGSAQVELWSTDGTLRQTLTINQPTISVVSVAFSPDGQVLATGSTDGSIKLWRMADGVLLKEITSQFDMIQQVVFGDQGRMIAAFDISARLGVWRVGDGSPVRTNTMPASSVTVYAFSPDGQLFATNNPNSSSAQVTLWRVGDGEAIYHFNLPHGPARSISLSADGKQLAIVDNHGLLIVTEVKVRPGKVNG
jgi:serine/threonine protein kinase